MPGAGKIERRICTKTSLLCSHSAWGSMIRPSERAYLLTYCFALALSVWLLAGVLVPLLGITWLGWLGPLASK